ncbi:hypothetical protein BASA83_010415 [Batrachochytrium salamandrivorans]|nr:hypothetical protein BASA83_010415 [Batrachochytrium salamandrivorans]
MNYGSPFELFTDRGSSFISEGIREYEKLQRIRHHATTPYHPQTNGMVERMHATWAMQLPRSLRVVQIGGTNICNRRYLHCESASMQSPSNHPSICFMVYTLDYQVDGPIKKPWHHWMTSN